GGPIRFAARACICNVGCSVETAGNGGGAKSKPRLKLKSRATPGCACPWDDASFPAAHYVAALHWLARIVSLCRQIDWLIFPDDRTIPPLHRGVKLGDRNGTYETDRHPAQSTPGEVVRLGLRAGDRAGLPCLAPGAALAR